MPRQHLSTFALFAASLALACGGTKAGIGVTNPAAVTMATPPPGPFNGSITVVLRTDKPALLFATIDGSDPHKASANRLTGHDTLEIPLNQTTTIRAFSRTDSGAEESVKTFEYVRAGGEVGTADGEIVVGLVAANWNIALQLDGQIIQMYPALQAPGKIPFSLTGLQTGTHTLRAAADRTQDGNFFPVLDYWSDTISFDIDLSDPFKASATGLQLLLGASETGLCTIEGIIKVPTAAIGQIVRMSAIDATALGGLLGGGGGGGGTGGAQALLTQLQNGYQVFPMGSDTEFPYAITGLQPGSYTGLPLLTSITTGGVGMNFFVDPFDSIRCGPGKVVRKDFEFGPINFSGHVHAPTSSGTRLAYGMAAARSVSLKNGIQVVLMPTVFIGGSSGPMSGSGLLDGSTFDLMAYTSLDSTMPQGGPLLAAMQWAINPLSSTPGQLNFHTSGQDVSMDITTQ